MASCGGCGATSARVRRTMTANGILLRPEEQKEICPSCHPEDFTEAFNPLDRVVTGPEAEPHLYTQNADGAFVMKDEALEDLRQKWDKGPSEEAKERKRRSRRTEPMSESEVNARRAWGDAHLRPKMESVI